MLLDYHEIAGAAVALPETDRARLVELLIGTLGPEEFVGPDDAVRELLEQRSQQIDEGTVKLVDWDVVKEDLRNRRRGHA